MEGEATSRTFERDGFIVEQEVLRASNARIRRPAGELLARWIATNVAGVGEVIACRLVHALPDLDRAVRQGDAEALTTVAGVSQDRARMLIESWPEQGLDEVLTWLQEADLPLDLGERLSRAYGESAVRVLPRSLPVARLWRVVRTIPRDRKTTGCR